ncbi:hypothetical protein PVAP13_8KG321106 [Panicum virgatum]|uniref:RRM domain-containing protein n=1 Tax=Panicum virgatum TaxID=38727 RepID=A0A8T0PMI6_PANVG|nr:hypothetical protein PVAP13_8KG321106 [Panicum virgatum]
MVSLNSLAVLLLKRVVQTYNGTMMLNVELPFRLNWASAGEKRDDSPDYMILVGDLAADVTDYVLQETFRVHYPSVKGAKVVTDKLTMRSKGYGFVKFGDPNEQARAMTEMNGTLCSSRPMRIGPAANKKATGVQEKVPSAQGVQSDDDPNNTTARSFFYFLVKQIIFILVLISCLAIEHRFLLVALTRMSLKIR